MASTSHARRPADRNSRLGLAMLSIGSIAMFVWLVASLAAAAF